MKSSKWSLASARSSKASSTSSRGSGRSTRSRVKAGTQRRVTAEIAPRAPRPTRAARSSSGSPSALSSRTLPSARTSSSASTWAEILRSLDPVPWVPVEIAPAIVWRSMSPRFSIASPRPSRRSLSSARTVPPATRTRPEEGSASSTPLSAETSIIVPSVSAASVKEWPEPGTLTVRPASADSATAAARASRSAGLTIRAGRHAWSPAQLRHSAIAAAYSGQPAAAATGGEGRSRRRA